jgi:hypothetical protein
MRKLFIALFVLWCAPSHAAVITCPAEPSRATAFGLSTDTKPSPGQPCHKFVETNTQDVYRWNGSSWVELPEGVTQQTLTAGEDQTNNVMRVEGQFSVCIDDADLVCKSSAGFLHSVWCYPEDGTATAGTVRVTNTTAAGGAETTEVWGMDFAAAAYTPVGQVLDIVMTTGITIDFTTTADMKCGVSYR